jgi:aminotransferase EvaB
MVVTSDDALAARLRRLRMYGTEGAYYSEEHGYNSRLDELHAEILRRKLLRIEAYIDRRRMLARRYDEQLGGLGLTLPLAPPERGHVYHLYVVGHPARDPIIKALASRDIAVGIHYPWPIHRMRGYAGLGYGEGALPVTEKAAGEIMSLPMYPMLTIAAQDRVCAVLREIVPGLRD